MITTLLYSHEILASPNTPARVRVDVVNSGSTAAKPRLDVIGLPGGWAEPIGPIPELAPNQSWKGDVSFTVPVAASHGRHLVMVRLTDALTGEICGTDRLTLTVLPFEGVVLALAPAAVRGRFRAKTSIVVTNRSNKNASLRLDGVAETLRLRCRPEHLEVGPGEVETAKLRVRARPRLFDDNRYQLSITASGSQLPIHTSGSFDHRPLIGSVARASAAVVFLLALAAGGFLTALRLLEANDDAPASTDSVEVTASDTTASADGTTTAKPDDANATSSDDETTTDGDDGTAPGTRFDQEGTVKLGGADDDLNAGVTVSLRRISLDNAASGSSVNGDPARGARKIFARGLERAKALDDTVAPIELTTAENGRWTHTGLVAGLHYEISFRRAGYTTQSFVVSPQRGVPLEPMEIELLPGGGSLGGGVSGPNGPLGGALVTVSDGQLTYTATTSTASGSLGEWSIESLGTPSRYVVRVSKSGFATEVISTDLGPGEARNRLTAVLATGVGSITGIVRASSIGLGGAVVTASTGDTIITTTTLTQGAPGTFSLPRLPAGIEYTLKVQADGWLAQTRTVLVGGAVDDIEIDLLADSGGAEGAVTNDQGETLGDVRVTIRSDTLSFETTTESTEGRWQVSGVPPGEYQVVFQRFNHLTAFTNITISAGASIRVPDPVLVFSTDPVLAANATLNGTLIDNNGQRVGGASVEIPGHDPALSVTSDADGRYEINGINFGSYLIRISTPLDTGTDKASHQAFEEYKTFTLNSTVSFSPTLFTNGAFNGTVTQASAPGVAVPSATVTVNGTTLTVPKVLVVDGSGEFNEADFFPPGDYTLVAYAPGYVTVTQSRTIPAGSPTPITVNFDMSLRPRLRVAVVAPTTSSTFTPVLDATVTLNPPASGTTGDLEKAVDDATGVAEFAEEQSVTPDADESTQLEPGTYTIDVVAPGYDGLTGHLETGVAIGEIREVTIALTGTAGDIRELATGTISYLYDSQPRVIADASVSAEVISGYVPGTNTDGVVPTLLPVTTTTDSNGVWSVADHRFGLSTYTVTKTNFTTGTVDVDVTPGVDTNGDLTLVAAPSALSGRLVLTTTDTTTALDSFQATASGPGDDMTVTLASDGSYTIPINEQGTWSVEISHAGGDNTNFDGLPGIQTGLSTDPGVTTSVADIGATELGSLSVDVFPSDADVRLCEADGTTCGTPQAPTSGTVLFTTLPAGSYTVQVVQSGYRTETSPVATITAGQDVILASVSLEEWGTLEGTLSGRRGSSGSNPTDSVLEGITVTATPTGGGDAYTASTGPDGVFSIAAPEDTYVLSFGLTGYEVSPLAPASLEFSTTVETPEPVGNVIFQASSVTLDIRVENDAGDLIDATINLSHADEADITNISHLASSSPVAAGPLQPLTWTIDVTAVGHNDLQTTVAVPPGGLGATLTIALPRNTGSITGVVRAEILGNVDIGPVGGVTVDHTPPGGGTGSTVTSDGSTGDYTVPNVVNGSNTLSFSKSNYTSESVSVVVSDQVNPTTSNIVLVPADGTITLSVADNATADFTALAAQLYLDIDAGGDPLEVGSPQVVGVDRTVVFTTPPSRPASDIARTHHYRIVLSGTGFVTKTIDNLDLSPGTPLTPATTIVSHPSAPGGLSVIARAAGGVTATWTAPTLDGGDSVDSYLVEWDLNSAGTFGNSTEVTGSLSLDIEAVGQGIDVSVRVRAKNEAGTGPPSDPATATAPSVPDAVGTVTATATAAAFQVDLSWAAPDANGSAITRYDIEYKLDTQAWGDATTVTSSTSSASVTGLTAGSTYEFRVRAVNGVGTGDYSNDLTATAANVPATPTNLAATAFADSAVTLGWDAADTNGSAILRYEYRIGTGTGISVGLSTSTTVSGLTNGTIYSFQVRAVNAIGDSDWSAVIDEIPRTTPATPTATAVTGGDSQISVTWTDPTDNGGAAITQYGLRHRTGSNNWVEVTDYTKGDPITGLAADTSYEVEVRAINSEGTGDWSTSASGTTNP